MNTIIGLIISLSQNGFAAPDELVFGILRDGDTPAELQRINSYMQAIKGLEAHFGPEVEIRIPVEYRQPPRKTEDNTLLEEQEEKLKSLLAIKEIDYIIASGPIGAKIVSDYGQKRQGLSKPVFAPTVYDAQLQGLAREEYGNVSGITNFHFVDIPYTFEHDLTAFSDIVPFSDLAVVVDEQVVQMLGKKLKENLLRRFPQVRNLEILSVGDSASPLISQLASLPETIEGIYITETYSMGEDQRKLLIENLNKLKKPTFSRLGKKDVEMGVFGGLMSKDTQVLRSDFLQESIKKHYLDKTPLKDLPVHVNVYGNLMINIETTASIGVALSWDVLAEAQQINGRTGYGRFGMTDGVEELNLASVLDVSDEHPLLRAEKENTVLLEYGIKKEESKTLPTLDASFGGFLNDPDRADQSLNLLPWYNVNTGVQVHQTLFSPGAQSAIRLSEEKYRFATENVERKKELLRQDLARVYMQLCHAFAQEHGYREMLGHARNIYDIALRRSKKDSKLQVDVLQLDAILQKYKKGVLDAQAKTRQMEIALNKVMWKPLDRSVQVTQRDILLKVPAKEALLMGYMKDPQSFPVFTKTLLERGISSNIDIKTKRAKQEYKRVELDERKKTMFDPTIGAYGGARLNLAQPYDERFDSDLLKDTISQRDNLDWTAGVYVQVPLFDGFYKKHELSQKYAEIAQEKYLVQNAERTLEADIRQQLIEINARYRSIVLNNRAKERSFSGFEAVLSDYEQGNVAVSDVLSIHSIATESYFEHIRSLFLFRSAFLSLLGEVGLLDYYVDQKISEEIFDELNTAYRQNGFTLPNRSR
ncbi:MAG: hypothetical protein CL916_06700 [Deltaproteobacteria bacterium]|nr:hypothetical protein [Deltaproteobacteria bacterium]